MRIHARILSFCFVACGWATCFAGAQQTDQTNPTDQFFQANIQQILNMQDDLAKLKLANGDTDADERGIRQRAGELTPYLFGTVTDMTLPSSLSQLEQDRLDKQMGTTTNAAGSTTLTSQGSIPAIFGFAVENGALSRSISGTTVTFSGSPANIYAALAKHGYIAAGPSVPPMDGSFEAFAKRASFSVSFDTSRGNSSSGSATTGGTGSNNLLFTGDRQQLSGFTIRYDLINKRDPRRPEYGKAWVQVLQDKGMPFINSLTSLINKMESTRTVSIVNYTATNHEVTRVGGDKFDITWTAGTRILIAGDEHAVAAVEDGNDLKLEDGPNSDLHGVSFSAFSPAIQAYRQWRNDVGDQALKATNRADLQKVFQSALASFKPILQNMIKENPGLEADVHRAVQAAAEFYNARNALVAAIMKSWTAAIEYNFVSQANTNGSAVTATGTKVSLPNLGNFNFVTSKGFTDGPEFTFNAGFTWFQAIPAGLQVGTIRDARASAELAFPLKQITNMGKPVLLLSGQFISLMEEPLGQKVTINGVDVSRTGNIGLGQVKLKIPTKNTGVSFPISVTWANRTELIKEKEVRGNFGVTFDFDKILSKP